MTGIISLRETNVSTSDSSMASTGTASSAPTAPEQLRPPSSTPAKATPGCMFTDRPLMRGSSVRFSTCWYRIPQASAATPIQGLGEARPTTVGRAIAMYVPIVGTNCATTPVHTPSASHDGMPISENTRVEVLALMVARMSRAET
ncbi:hypothetical protein GCM10020001_099610 [Nonomuraea salmonea]